MAPPKINLPDTLPELLSVEKLSISDDGLTTTFVTKHNPVPMGFQVISFGGCTMGMAATAAISTLLPNQTQFRAYSLLGNFLGGAFIDRKLKLVVKSVRDTRTFATRMVEVRQTSGKLNPQTGEGDGEERTVLLMTVDFHAPESASLLTYSLEPSQEWTKPEDSKTFKQVTEDYVARGLISEKLSKVVSSSFGLARRFIETRYCAGTPCGESLMGFLRKTVPLSQQDRPLAQRVSADWFKYIYSLDPSDQIAQLGVLTFAADLATSFIPLMNDGRWLGDTSACSSLDFALRIFANEFDISKFHLRELTSTVGGDGRVFTFERFWNADGHMLAEMSQQCILRPLPSDSPAKI
jgi:acyl-CoA thioesterase II